MGVPYITGLFLAVWSVNDPGLLLSYGANDVCPDPVLHQHAVLHSLRPRLAIFRIFPDRHFHHCWRHLQVRSDAQNGGAGIWRNCVLSGQFKVYSEKLWRRGKRRARNANTDCVLIVSFSFILNLYSKCVHVRWKECFNGKENVLFFWMLGSYQM